MGAESEKSKELLKNTKTKMFDSVEDAINGVVMEVNKRG
jgi:succinyl-CoA synthetase beta subunit